ncbi:hypothetical protein MMC24_000651 [Lignoscripta atroalba]|nr:hypothetical protein [Lignoscripta atroalba]
MPSTIPTPKSQHVSDLSLRPFLSPAFDPTDYLNSTLPSLSLTSSTQPTRPPESLSLSDLASQTQTHIAQVSAQTSRLTDTLTDLTDDILRSGSRLAYEVEILRGEAISLSEALTEGLQFDISKFVPEGLAVSPPSPNDQAQAQAQQRQQEDERKEQEGLDTTEPSDTNTHAAEPTPITRLRTLHLVRQRLHSTITTFDHALSWPLPPSSLSSTSTSTSTSNPLPSSLITISAPSPPPSSSLHLHQPHQATLEEQGLSAAHKLRSEISELLSTAAGGEDEEEEEEAEEERIEAAEARVQELRTLVGVWKGTVEEKARMKFVEGLARVVQERRVQLQQRQRDGRGGPVVSKGMGRSSSSTEIARSQGKRGGESSSVGGGGGGGGGPGFLRNLQRLRDEIYLD